MNNFSIPVDQDIKEATSGYSIVPAGFYHVQLTDITSERATNGTDFIKLHYQIIEGDYENMNISDSVFFKSDDLKKQKTLLSRIVRIANRLGFPNENGKINITDQWIGAKCWVKVSVEETEKNETIYKNNKIGFADYYSDDEARALMGNGGGVISNNQVSSPSSAPINRASQI